MIKRYRNLSREQVYRMQKYVKSVSGYWNEGMKERMVDLLIWNFKLNPRYYWKQADSFIFHRNGYMNWWCISRPYYLERKKRYDKKI